MHNKMITSVKRQRIMLLMALSVVILAGCARRPLVDNSTGYTTAELVSKIRCEMVHAVYRTAFLELERNQDIYGISPGELSFINQGPIIIQQKRKYNPSKRILDFVNIFRDNAIAYDFEFDITVRNYLEGSIGWSDPFGKNLWKGAVSASTDQKRRNKRNFRVEETYGALLANIPEGCTDKIQQKIWDSKLRRPYPITNSLGLRETAETFW